MFDKNPFDTLREKAKKFEATLNAADATRLLNQSSQLLKNFDGLNNRVGQVGTSFGNTTKKVHELEVSAARINTHVLDMQRTTEKLYLVQAKLTKNDYARLKFYKEEKQYSIDRAKRLTAQLALEEKKKANSKILSVASKLSVEQSTKDISRVSAQLAMERAELKDMKQDYHDSAKGIKHPDQSKVLRRKDAAIDRQVDEVVAQAQALEAMEATKRRQLKMGIDAEISIRNQTKNIGLLNEALMHERDIMLIINKLENAHAEALKANVYESRAAALRKIAKPINTAGTVGLPEAHRISASIRLVAQLITELGAAFAPFVILVGILALIVKLAGDFREALKETIALGLDASQRMGVVAQSYRVVGLAAKDLALITNKEAIVAFGALSEKLATLDIPDALVVKSAELTRQIEISAGNAGEILQFFTRIRGQAPDIAAQSATVVKAVALMNHMNPALVMNDVAENAANFAKSGKAGADEIGRAAVLARQMGTSLSTITNIADKVVTDFEGTLEAQAKINTIAPGFNMAPVLIASQFGSDADIASALKSSIQGMGMKFDQMTRSMKLQISSALGMNVQELANIMGDKKDALTPDANAIVAANKNLQNEIHQGLVSPVNELLRVVTGGFGWLVSHFGKGNEVDKAAKLSDKDLASEIDRKQKIQALGFPSSMKLTEGLDTDMLEQQKRQTSSIVIKLENQGNSIDDAGRRVLDFSRSEVARLEAKLQALKMGSFASGGVIGNPTQTTSLANALNYPKNNELLTLMHKGETVFNPKQMEMLHEKLATPSFEMPRLDGMVSSMPFSGNTIAATQATMPQMVPANVTPASMTYESPLLQSPAPIAPERPPAIIESRDKGTDEVVKKLEELIQLMVTGKIVVHMDGQKVSSGLIDANRYS